MPRLSQQFAKSLDPVERDTWHWDDTLKGFAVRQRPGLEPQWWVRYSINRQKRKHLIGPCSVVKAEAARDRARDILEGARLGKDHNATKQAERDAPTIKDLSEVHLEIQVPPAISAGYYRDKKSAWKNHLIPALGKTRVSDLSKSDVQKFLNRYKSKPALGNGLLAILSKAISDSTEFKPPWRPDNPCRGIEKFTVDKRQRILSKEEMGRVLEHLSELKKRTLNYPLWSYPWLFELLLITGLRMRELANRKWTDFDLEAGILTIPKPKGKKKDRVVALSSAAISVLESMPRRGLYVFPNSKNDAYFNSPQKHWNKIRKDLELTDVRVHDLRHTVGSYAHNVAGLSQREVMELLGHSQMSTTERYLNVHDENKKSISDRAALGILSIFGHH